VVSASRQGTNICGKIIDVRRCCPKDGPHPSAVSDYKSADAPCRLLVERKILPPTMIAIESTIFISNRNFWNIEIDRDEDSELID